MINVSRSFNNATAPSPRPSPPAGERGTTRTRRVGDEGFSSLPRATGSGGLRRRILPLVVSATVVAVVGAFAADEWRLPSERVDLAPGPGREVVAGQCILCHSTDYISTQPKLTRAQWQSTVDKMRVRYGAPLTTNQVPGVVEYLTTAYGRKATP